MEKLVYLLFDSAERDGAELREDLIGTAAARLREAGASRIAVNVNDEDVPHDVDSLRRQSNPPIRAMVSFWMENSDDRRPCERALEDHAKRICGYLVVESIPLVNTEHRVAPGERTPGANVIACVRRKPGLPDHEFYDIWFNDQKTVAIECQDSFGYKRNAVVRHLTAGARVWDGIVEESFSIEALRDPKVWYDARSDEEFERNVGRMMANVERFLDSGPLETTPMSEYLLD